MKKEINLIEVNTPLYPIWKNGSPTNRYKVITNYINPEMIVCIEPYTGTMLHEGWDCSKITVSDGLKSKIFYDQRQPKELFEIINS
jgi:hypothetical protein